MEPRLRKKVLVIDNEEAFAKAIAERLNSRGFAAETAFNGRDALESIDRDEPEILIIDLKMPGMDGFGLLRLVRQNYPNIQAIFLSGHGTDSDKKTAASLGALDFLDKPADLHYLTQKIRAAFEMQKKLGELFFYGNLARSLKNLLAEENIILGENGLGIKCFCRDDNQDQLAYLLMNTCSCKGWFDLNSFGAYPAGRSIESFGPPSHHIPELRETPWTVVFHATHVGCDSSYTLGLTDRFGMRRPSTSCGLLAAILNRHANRQKGIKTPSFEDFEMREAEIALLPYLDEIAKRPYPIAAAAEILFDLGRAVFDSLLQFSSGRSLYIGGINVDYDAAHPENNLFIPKSICTYESGEKRELSFQ